MSSALLACSPGGTPTSTPTPEPTPEAVASIIPGATFTIGDVETSLVFTILATDDLKNEPNVEVEEVENFRKRIVKSTVTITGDPPAQLPLLLVVSSRKNYEEHVVQVRGHLELDGREIRPLSGVFAKDAMDTPIVGVIDIRNHLDAVPETFLVTASAEIVLFRDTDISAVTVETPVPEDAERVTIYSNTLRVNIVSPSNAEETGD